jgi:hypothetical protein
VKKVLYIALEFPPQNNTGTYRTLKFVKYLPEYGIEPIVLTLTTESSEAIFGAKSDYKLLDELNGIEIHRVPAQIGIESKNKVFNYFKIFFRLHDNIVNNWEKKAQKKIDFLISKHEPESVIITFPPFSCSRLVKYIKKKFDIKVIVDFRDAWSAWGNNFFPSYLHYRLIKRLESDVFNRTDIIVTVTDELKEKFIKIHGEKIRNKIEVITNGFDFELSSNEIITSSLKDKEHLRIGYIGSFYYDPKLEMDNNKPLYKRKINRIWQYSLKEEDWKYRSPYYFLISLKELILEFPDYKNRIIFEHIGATPSWLITMIGDLGLTENFYSHGFNTHARVKEIANGFDYLLATSEKNIVGPHYCLPSKLFDYLELNKPILAFVTEGSQKKFLNESGRAYILNPERPIESSKKMHLIFTNQEKLGLNRDYLFNYNRRKLTQNLSKIILSN